MAPSSGVELAAKQVLTYPVPQDVQNLDPLQVGSLGDFIIVFHVFSGLYKPGPTDNVVPDIAEGAPDISADGRTWTIHLKKGVRFSNGDPVRAQDFKYSWDRAAVAAAQSGGTASTFGPIQGSAEVDAGTATTLSGLTARDDQTLVIALSQPDESLYARMWTLPFFVVDERAIRQFGDTTWWQTPQGLVGTGPFKVTGRDPGRSIDLEPVPGWWGGSPGVLQHVHIDVVPDEAAAVQGFESGRFDMLGSWYDMRQFPNIEPPFEAASSRWKPLITTCCGVEFVAFNLAEGPFAGPGGKPGRIAFSQAIDRAAVVRAIDHVPQHAYLTDSATGGPITKGMRGYLGDGRDPYAKVNPTAARALYAQWDPDGSKVKGLAFTYNPTPINDAEARALQAQWKANLGVDVQLQPVDPQTFFDGQSKNLYTMFRQGFARTYNDPEEALDILFRPSFGGIPAGASSPQLDALLTTARQDRPEHALADYLRAAQMVVDDALVATLFYPQHFLVTQPYVEGGRVKPFGDGWQWTDLRILKH